MGADKEIIVALEFGTSAIRGIAGKRKADGTTKILGIEQERITDAIQRGVIYNIDKTTQAISSVIGKLNERLNINICRAYVGIAGQSLHTVSNYILRGLETKVKITPELVDNLMDNNRNTQYPESTILEVVPQEYVVGNRSVADPIGIQTDQMEACFLNVVAKSVLVDNINKCMRMAGVEIADILISPLALADSLLTDSEKRSGCALIDFGAGTTTVAVFLGNLLRHLAVIPIGGGTVTADLAKSYQMEHDEAESLKRKHGVAYVASESDTPQQLAISNDRTISENELQNIIGARQEEIILNAWNQIKSLSPKLLAGIIITGGAAQLKDMSEAIKHYTEFQKVKMAKSLITTSDVGAGVTAPQGNNIDTLIALLMHGDTNCITDKVQTGESVQTDQEAEGERLNSVEPVKTDEKEPDGNTENKENVGDEEVDTPKPPRKGFLDRLKNFGNKWSDMFTEE